MNLLDELAVVLVLAGLDHGADGVHHPQAVLLEVRVRLHVGKVLSLHLGIRFKKTKEIFSLLFKHLAE